MPPALTPQGLPRPETAPPEVTAADMRLVKDLVHALAAEIDARDGEYRLSLAGLRARLDLLQRQTQDNWNATQRFVSVLHTEQMRKE